MKKVKYFKLLVIAGASAGSKNIDMMSQNTRLKYTALGRRGVAVADDVMSKNSISPLEVCSPYVDLFRYERLVSI